MNAEITKDTDGNGVPYTELRISPEDEFYEITFRKYPKRIFVAVEDNRNNPSSGADLSDCWIAPAVILEKTLHADFKPFEAFIEAEKHLGNIHRPADPNEPVYDLDYYTDEYSIIEGVVEEWRKG